jgi:hypothetical protein
VNVTRLMVLRISNEQDIGETKRCHAPKYNPSNLGYQARPRTNPAPQIKFSSGSKKPTCVLVNCNGWNSTSKS